MAYAPSKLKKNLCAKSITRAHLMYMFIDIYIYVLTRVVIVDPTL